MNPELKKLLDDLQKTFNEMRTANDERLAQIEARGSADAALVTRVEQLNTAITGMQVQVRALETEGARVAPAPGAGRAADVSAQAARFFSEQTRQRVATPSAAQIEMYQRYRPAFENYLRAGDRATEIQAALSVGSDPAGGYRVPPDLSGRIVELLRETSPMRQYATVSQTSRDAKEGFNDLNEAGSGWVGERQARTETATPDLGKWRIPVAEQYAEPQTTQQELEDADVDVEAWLARKVADKLAREENLTFVSGNGVQKPRGFLTYAAGVPSASAFNVIEQTNTGAAGAFAGTSPADVFITAVGLLKSALRQGAVFAMNRSTEAACRKLKDAQGNYLLVTDFSKGAASSILGYSVAPFEDMPAIGANSLSIAFGNFGAGYEIVDRRGIVVLRDPFTNKPFVKFYTTKRVGGDVVNFEAIKLIKFAA